MTDPEDRKSIKQILSARILSNIKLEGAQNRAPGSSLLPEQLKSSYILYTATCSKNSIDIYMNEEVYFGFSVKSSQPVRFRLTGFSNPAVIRRHMERVQQFGSIRDENLVTVHEAITDNYRIILVDSYCNQGCLRDYTELKFQLRSQGLSQKQVQEVMFQLYFVLERIGKKFQFHGAVHPNNVYINKDAILLGAPYVFNDQAEKRIRENQKKIDFLAPEFKSDALKLIEEKDLSKVDIWGYGFILFYLNFGDDPKFNRNLKPEFPDNMQIPVKDQTLITKCLDLTPDLRCGWEDVVSSDALPAGFRQRKQDKLAK